MQQCRVVCDNKCPVELYGETHSADLRLFATVGNIADFVISIAYSSSLQVTYSISPCIVTFVATGNLLPPYQV